MNIVLSAHFDLAHPVMSIHLDSEKLTGLVDNFAGVFVSYQASRKTGVPVYFTNYEELDYDGTISVPGEYHSVDNSILLEKIDNAAEILDKLVRSLQVV
jgi:hypothetical protein